MLTDEQFERTKLPESVCTYFTFGFVPCSIHEAVGMVEHTRLGATRYYVQVGTVRNPRWLQTDYEGYFEHCKAIQLSTAATKPDLAVRLEINMEKEIKGFKVTSAMIVNPDDYIPTGKFNPHHVRPWLILNEYGPLCVVFASCEQDALDEAVDNDRLDSCLIAEENYADYGVYTDDDQSAHLGNAGEPFDLDYIGLEELPNSELAEFVPQDEED